MAPVLFLSNMFALYGSTVLLSVAAKSDPLLKQATADDGLTPHQMQTVVEKKKFVGRSRRRSSASSRSRSRSVLGPHIHPGGAAASVAIPIAAR